MARYVKKHQLQKGLAYHILNRGNARSDVFHDEEDFIYFKELLKRYRETHGFFLYHWVLMNNHFHLVMEMEEPEGLSATIAGILRSYVHYHHKKYNSAGHLWQGRFKSQAIEKKSYLLACGRYVEQNPLRARLVDYPWEWPHSSAKFYCLGAEDQLTVPDPIWDKERNKTGYKQYQKWLGKKIEEEEENFFRTLNKAVGSETFLARLIRIKDRDMPRRKGRHGK